jgi:hypothetical protein
MSTYKLAAFPTFVALAVLAAVTGCAAGDGTDGARTESETASLSATSQGGIDERCQGHEACNEVCGPNQDCGAACWRYVVDAPTRTRHCEQVTCNTPGLSCERTDQPNARPSTATLELRSSALRASR